MGRDSDRGWVDHVSMSLVRDGNAPYRLGLVEVGNASRKPGDDRIWVRARRAYFAADDPTHAQYRHDAMPEWLAELARIELDAINRPDHASEDTR
jgi:hypothetical protein